MNREDLDRIHAALDNLAARATDIQVSQARHEENLREHMRRTAAVEESNTKLAELIVAVREGFAKQMQPVQKHVDRVQFLIAAVIGAGAVTGAIYSIQQFLRAQ